MNKSSMIFFVVLVALAFVVVLLNWTAKDAVPIKEHQPTAVVVTSPLVKNVPQKDDIGKDKTENTAVSTNAPNGVLIRTAVTFSFNDDEKGEKRQK